LSAAVMLAERGTGTGTRALDVMLKACSIHTLLMKNFSKNGTGQRSFLPNQIY
jgi:hypothetical protein